jgi:hypothetical protein
MKNYKNYRVVTLIAFFILLFLSSFAMSQKSTSAKKRYLDNGNGTISDLKTELMWTKKDSYNVLGKCLTWYEAVDYVKNLKNGGHVDWRLPSIEELKSIFEEQSTINSIYKYKAHLNSVFIEPCAVWYWSSDDPNLCCAYRMVFTNGKVFENNRENCENGGVRAVRNIR